jgi:hypothetical protein
MIILALYKCISIFGEPHLLCNCKHPHSCDVDLEFEQFYVRFYLLSLRNMACWSDWFLLSANISAIGWQEQVNVQCYDDDDDDDDEVRFVLHQHA